MIGDKWQLLSKAGDGANVEIEVVEKADTHPVTGETTKKLMVRPPDTPCHSADRQRSGRRGQGSRGA